MDLTTDPFQIFFFAASNYENKLICTHVAYQQEQSQQALHRESKIHSVSI